MFTFPTSFWASASAGLSVVEIGSVIDTTNTSSMSITVPAGGVPLGALIMLAIYAAGSQTVSSNTDTGGNTYGGANSQGNSPIIYSRFAPVTAALVSGNSISVTLSGNSNPKMMHAAYVTGLAFNSNDRIGNASGTSTSPSATLGNVTTGPNGDVLHGVLGLNAAANITEDGTFTQFPACPLITGNAHLNVGYRIVPSGSIYSYAPSLSASVAWRDVIAAFK